MLKGKGYFIWRLANVMGGNAQQIANAAAEAGLAHVEIKIADGPAAYNGGWLKPAVDALHALGIQVWGWHYVYANDPTGEAVIAIAQCKSLNLDGYIIDAEKEYVGKAVQARQFMSLLRAGIGTLPVALCSYRFPSVHQDFPFAAFLEKCDLNMPQMYWEDRHDPAAQLQRCVSEFNNPALVGKVLPVFPVGSAYRGLSGWIPTADDWVQFMTKAKTMNLDGFSSYTWDFRTQFESIWEAVASFSWPTTVPPVDPGVVVNKEDILFMIQQVEGAQAMLGLTLSVLKEIQGRFP